jgi:hypothetical protein
MVNVPLDTLPDLKKGKKSGASPVLPIAKKPVKKGVGKKAAKRPADP